MVRSTILALEVAAMTAFVHALPTFIPLNPNSLAIPWTVAIGHIDPAGGGANNQYGLDFMANGFQWSPTLACMDSDADGFKNGNELGDPCGTWTPGATPPITADISHPGNATSVPQTRNSTCATCASLEMQIAMAKVRAQATRIKATMLRGAAAP